jgi:hypothetical protein
MSSALGPWTWGDLGFDTAKKLWFVDLHDYKGSVKLFLARKITLKDGPGIQYQWPDKGPREFWHVRERFFVNEVRSIGYDEDGTLVVEFVKVEAAKDEVPQNYSYLTYAYSLHTSRGFVEFYDSNDKLLKTIHEKWILVEDLTRVTTGEYPMIRLRAEREHVKEIVISKNAIIIRGILTPDP